MSTSLLSDGDHARTELGAHRRRSTSVADADAAYRADLIERYVVTCASGGDEFAELALLAEAARYDAAHPGELPLADEMHGTQLRRAA